MVQPTTRPADSESILELVLIAAGFVLGLALGRWWILLVAVVLGLWAGTNEEVEVSGWVIGVGYGVLSGLGIASGVAVRRMLARPARRETN